MDTFYTVLETKLRTIDSFYTYESNCQLNRDIAGKKEHKIEKRMYFL